jgi:hypothetical protein
MFWEERLTNSELQEKLLNIGFGRECIGIYMRMPRTMADVFDGWPGKTSEHFQSAVFCLYLDLIWLQSACEAIAALILAKSALTPANAEYEATASILSEFPELLQGSQVRLPLSFRGLSALLYQKRRGLERWVACPVICTIEIVSVAQRES